MIRLFSLPALLLATQFSSAITREVVAVYRPLSYHFTDTTVVQADGERHLQADCQPQMVVLAGAFPEDLVSAIGAPTELESNEESYPVKEANLLQLCKVQIEGEQVEAKVRVTLNGTTLEIPDEIDISQKELLELALESLRRTLREYYSGIEESGLRCVVTLEGWPKELAEEFAKKLSFAITSA